MTELFAPKLVIFFLLVASMMIPLERIFPLRRGQKLLRPEIKTDLAHFFLTTILLRIVSIVAVTAIAVLLQRFVVSPDIQAAVAAQPGWVQFIAAVLITNFVGYWTHRWSHEWPLLWRFHAIHHSSAQLDWLSSTRLHVIDQTFSRALRVVPIFLLGFSKETFGLMLVIGPFIGILVHANVKLSSGPLRWLYISPQYHHWHHALTPQNKNYAPSLPVMDLLFGTAYCPRGRWPQAYGVDFPIRASWLAHLRGAKITREVTASRGNAPSLTR